MTVGKAISMLRSAIVNARIYPKGSQMVESTIKAAQQALESCLEETSPIVISDIQGKLCVNGKELPEAKDFRPFLIQQEVQSLKFLKGLDLSEVSSLIDALGKRKGQLGDRFDLDLGAPRRGRLALAGFGRRGTGAAAARPDGQARHEHQCRGWQVGGRPYRSELH